MNLPECLVIYSFTLFYYNFSKFTIFPTVADNNALFIVYLFYFDETDTLKEVMSLHLNLVLDTKVSPIFTAVKTYFTKSDKEYCFMSYWLSIINDRSLFGSCLFEDGSAKHFTYSFCDIETRYCRKNIWVQVFICDN